VKVVILAGGFGTRISEESYLIPKPMVEIGGRPILWHIMKQYSHFGLNEFILCAGYKQHVIKEFFANYFLHTSDITFDIATNTIETHHNYAEPWRVTVVDTGLNTLTGGRIKRIKDFISDEPFLMTYGDAVSDVDISAVVDFHYSHGKLATLTTVQPEGRFGTLAINDDQRVLQFKEKRHEDAGWVNAGFMVLNPEVFDYIKGDTTTFEAEPLERLAIEGNLKAYKHYGFWQCMYTVHEKEMLEQYWANGEAPWRVWENTA
jgi:glucose-1-phosphate cytidylyltransferase